MFAWWGRTVVRLRWVVLVGALAVVAVGGLWGSGVFDSLSAGGFEDPDSPSAQAHARMAQELGPQGFNVIVLYSAPTQAQSLNQSQDRAVQVSTVDDAAYRDAVLAVLQRLSARPEVVAAASYYTVDPKVGAGLVSADRRATYIGIRLRGDDEDARLAELATIRPDLAAGAGLQTEVGGITAFATDVNKQIEKDLKQAELISLPILLILMILIFRGVVAALTPLLVGVIAILGALSVTRVLTHFTDVSVFAANVITMLGLGMAIDYALFVVSRFREELAAGRDPAQAVAATMATAGRTVFVSALTVAFALSSLMLFPMNFLKSMAYGGVAAVLVAMLAALTALPALLVVLGRRIDAIAVPLPRFGRRGAGAWARLAHVVMRRPVLFLVSVSLILLALATPFLRVEFGGYDERVLPTGTASRTVTERIAAEFPGGSVAPIAVLLSGAEPQTAAAFAAHLATLPGITSANITGARGSSYLIAVSYDGAPTTKHARDLARDVRAQTPPANTEVLVGGRPAADMDLLDSLQRRLAWMALYVGSVTFVLLFLAFGSLVLPLKAIVMNVISIGASFGVVVWVFQDGHFADALGFTSTGFLEPTNLILMLAILFGLSTDYEVFLLSRVREEWDRSGDNTSAVALGLQRTGGIISAAALLLIIVIGGFATGGTASIKMLGLGTVVAVAVDAALVRALLVPATMRLLGRWNWWAPAPLARLHQRIGLRESG